MQYDQLKKVFASNLSWEDILKKNYQNNHLNRRLNKVNESIIYAHVSKFFLNVSIKTQSSMKLILSLENNNEIPLSKSGWIVSIKRMSSLHLVIEDNRLNKFQTNNNLDLWSFNSWRTAFEPWRFFPFQWIDTKNVKKN